MRQRIGEPTARQSNRRDRGIHLNMRVASENRN